MARYDQCKSPTPSYLGCIFTLASRGASVDLRVEYVNDLDTLIHERTCARRSKLRCLLKVYVRRKDKPPNSLSKSSRVWTSELPSDFTLFT